jgi:outer membrane protein assembly factor BamB
VGKEGKGRIPAPPAVGVVKLLNNQEFVFGTYDDAREGGTVWAVNSATGALLWPAPAQPSETRAGTRSRPLFLNERLYVPFMDGRVYELDVVTGHTKRKWFAGAASSFISSIVLEGGLAWLVSGDGHLYGFDLGESRSRRRQARTFDAGRAATTDLTVAGGVAYFGDERGRLHAVELGRLTRPWQPVTGEGKVIAKPAVSDRRVYFGTSEGWVYAVDREGGTLVWKYRVGEEVEVSCVYLTGRYLLAGARDGIVYAFDEELVP